jgi:hypothetical protein
MDDSASEATFEATKQKHTFVQDSSFTTTTFPNTAPTNEIPSANISFTDLLQAVKHSNKSANEVCTLWYYLCRLYFKEEDGFTVERNGEKGSPNQRIAVYGKKCTARYRGQLNSKPEYSLLSNVFKNSGMAQLRVCW